MDTNNFFSFPRIAMVMKREIMENWKTNMFRFIGLYAAFAAVMIGNMWGLSMSHASSTPDSSFFHFCTNLLVAFTIIVSIASLIYASGIMDNMVTKEKRISFLMLPATMIEKFIARFLMATLGFVVALFIALSLAEVTRYIVLPLFNLPDSFRQSALLEILSRCALDGEQHFRGPGAFDMPYANWLGEAWGWCFLIWSHSLYILGGNYWYKKPFFKTLGVLILISILGSIIMVQIVEWAGADGMRNFGEWLEANFEWMTLNKFLALGVAFFSAFTMFNWWLSYRLFTRSQVIKPKFRLL